MSIFYVYTLHNIINNKIYIGKAKDPQKRLNKHIRVASGKRKKEKFYIHRAISKYGIDSFTFSIIQTLNSENDANIAERYWIKFFNSNNNEYGYNQTEGGEGVSGRIVSEETRQKIREKTIGRKHTQETLLNISGENNHKSKLTFNNIKEIRDNYNLYSIAEMSRQYNVSQGTIARAIYNKDWYDENYIPPVPRKINHTGLPKLNQEKANNIRKLYESGTNKLELAKLFNVTKTNIGLIIKRKIWNE